ncbi:hypothetical protein [Citromicrobium bathyomarinum]|uniref:hypothetical protein n=1 Tax=Citromicrobium bathyomarinum TaxID=72174 RepID=UPI00315A13CA
MGEDVALHIGAADLGWSDLWVFAISAAIGAGIGLVVWGRWHLRDWRIRRAIGRGDHDQADLLALDHDDGARPRPLRHILKGLALILIGTPALMVFQINFADELEHLLGQGWGVAATMLTIGFLMACWWIWEKVKRNAMSPDELAALEEDEEHRRWLRSIDGDSMPGLFAALAYGAAILAGLYFLFAAITPG